MKFSVRNNVFETNSSSTHAVTVLNADQFENWKNSKFLLDMANPTPDTAHLITAREFVRRWRTFYERSSEYVNDIKDDTDYDLENYFSRTGIYSYHQFDEAIQGINEKYVHYGMRDPKINKTDSDEYEVSVTYRIS